MTRDMIADCSALHPTPIFPSITCKQAQDSHNRCGLQDEQSCLQTTKPVSHFYFYVLADKMIYFVFQLWIRSAVCTIIINAILHFEIASNTATIYFFPDEDGNNLSLEFHATEEVDP